MTAVDSTRRVSQRSWAFAALLAGLAMLGRTGYALLAAGVLVNLAIRAFAPPMVAL